MVHTPGYITVSKQSWYDTYPDLDARIHEHIAKWAASVPVGTCMTINKMLNCFDGCGCSDDGHQQSVKCKGSNHGLPIEVVVDHVFPEGAICAIEGVEGISGTRPWQIKRIF